MKSSPVRSLAVRLRRASRPLSRLGRQLTLTIVVLLGVVLSHNMSTTVYAAALTVTNTNDSGAGSLRQAILDSNASVGDHDTITFNIPGATLGTIHTITPASELPLITDWVTIDGWSQGGAGYQGRPLIELKGTAAAGNRAALYISSTAYRSIVRGLVINGFTGPAIQLDSNSNVVEGNYLGTNVDGTAAVPNGWGVYIDSTGNRIGGTTAAQRNILSGNTQHGISITIDATVNTIQGNYIGTNAAGNGAVPNTGWGISINGKDNIIGGKIAGAGNVISGNSNQGIYISGTTANENTIQGNYIGTNAVGSADLGNGSDGVVLTAGARDNVIGGSEIKLAIPQTWLADLDTGTLADDPVADIQFQAANTTQRYITPRNGATIAKAPAGTTEPPNCVGVVLSSASIPITATELPEGSYVCVRTTQNRLLAVRIDAPPPVNLGTLKVSYIDASIVGTARNVISGNDLAGVAIGRTGPCAGAAGPNNVVAGNYIGTDAAGASPIPNAAEGVIINDCSARNTIGGTESGARNLISGNAGTGVGIVNASNNAVQGNYIGTNASGTGAIGNGTHGVSVSTTGADATTGNVIGGTVSGAGNVISGNGTTSVIGGGVRIDRAGSTVVQGNYVGTNAAGDADLGNRHGGIYISTSSNNTIGGATTGARNIISGNGFFGVSIDKVTVDSTSNTVQNNFIGTNKTGDASITNDAGGIRIWDALGNTIRDNVISGNTGTSGSGQSVGITGHGNTVQGNKIGTNSSGTGALPNGSVGVWLSGSNNIIGGTASGQTNIIAHHTDDGVRVDSGATGNAIRGNSIFANGGLGIDLGNNGVTVNDAGDGDTGANNLQNFPDLVAATPGTTTTVFGGLNSTASTAGITFQIDFYASDSCDASGLGEGQTYLGSISATTEPSGEVYFTATDLTSAGAEGRTVTAAATDPAGNTSEFSQCVLLSEANDTWAKASTVTPGQTRSQFIFKQGQARWYKFPVSPGAQVRVKVTGQPGMAVSLHKDVRKAYEKLTTPASAAVLTAEAAPGSYLPGSYLPGSYLPGSYLPGSYLPGSYLPGSYLPGSYLPGSYLPGSYLPGSYLPGSYLPGSYLPGSYLPGSYLPGSYLPGSYLPGSYLPGSYLPGSYLPQEYQDNLEEYSGAELRSLIGISAVPNAGVQTLDRKTWDFAEDFYVRVVGPVDTATPFTLEVTLQGGVCGGIEQVPSTLAMGPLPADGGQTLILWDSSRMPGTSEEKAGLGTKLAEFASRSDIAGRVIDLGSNYPRVAWANTQADSKRGCPTTKNMVATEIKSIIQAYRAANSGLQYLVLVGSDHVIPFFRYPDVAGLALENEYEPPVDDASASQASLRQNYVLGQDAYGSKVDISRGDHAMPIPDLPVGRLVETATEAIGMLDAYTAVNGVVAPGSGLVTGYDFVRDAAHGATAELDAALDTGVPDTLIDDQSAWNADQMRQKLLGSRHDVVFFSGHFSAGHLFAADDKTDMAAAEVVASPVDLRNAIILALGCHSGYNIPTGDKVADLSPAPDWAKAFASKGATFFAATGYAYGDTDLTEYGERLYVDLLKQLRTGGGAIALGTANVEAKKLYLATHANLGGLDEKTVLETTLYGLPMLKVNMPGPRLSSGPGASIVSAVTAVPSTTPGTEFNLATATVDVGSSFSADRKKQKVFDANGTQITATYYEGTNGVVANPLEPIRPLELRNVKVDNQVLRGVGFRGGASTDETIIPWTSAPATEYSRGRPAFYSDVFYPTQVWDANNFGAIDGGAPRLVVAPAQYKSASSGALNGTLRKFSNMNFRLYYMPSTWNPELQSAAVAAAPEIVRAFATANNDGTVMFSANVLGNVSVGIQEVWITYTDANAPGTWQSINLVRSSTDPTLWEASASNLPSNIRFMVQAVNGTGLVTLSTNFGQYYSVGRPVSTPPAPRQATTVTFESAPPSGAYHRVVEFRAVLRANGSALGSKPVTLALGGQQVHAMTGSDGKATFAVPLNDRPGTYEASVSFAGDTTYLGTSAASSFDIQKDATSLALTATSGYDAPVVATLKDSAGRPISAKSVVFIVHGSGGSHRRTVSTNAAGQAVLGAVPLPAGGYTVDAYFSGAIPLSNGSTVTLKDPFYVHSRTTGSLEVTTVEYIGNTNIAVGSTLQVTATVKRAAGAAGDLTKAKVRFDIRADSGAIVGSTTPAVGADGTATSTISNLPIGVYRIEATVVDGFFTSPVAVAFLAVYDPNGPFVTGGGWIDSPLGAYAADPTLTGRAPFGFVSKYKPGTNQLTGKTEFQFKAAGLNFKSSAYEWLVVSGARAQFKGTGTINGAGNYGFLLTAIDGQISGGGGTDKFRIKIWDKSDNDTVVYDNQAGKSDTGSDATALGGGSITIKK